jgi:hypothetical protein
MSKKPTLNLASKLSPETQAKLEQLAIKADSKTSNIMPDTVNALKQIKKPEDRKLDIQKVDIQKTDSHVSQEQETLLANNLEATNLQTPISKESNKKASLKLKPEELELKKQEQLLIDKKVKQYQKQMQIFSTIYPKCFTPNPKPLAIGLDKIIVANEELKPEESRISKTSIRRFLGAYTKKYKYLQSCILGAARIDLGGNEVDVIDQDAADNAKVKLDNNAAWQNKCKSWKHAMSKIKHKKK